MGDVRQPEVNHQRQETSTGIERASTMLLDEFLQGDFNVRRNARPLLNEACQIPTLTLTDDNRQNELAVRTNVYSLATRMDFQSPSLRASFDFLPSTGWSNPFRRPTYDLTAQTTDRSTMLHVNSTDGAAPSIEFGHNRSGFGLSYLRNPQVNTLALHAESTTSAPLNFNFGHDFRGHRTTIGLTGQPAPLCEFGIGASTGPRNYYDVHFFLRVGARGIE